MRQQERIIELGYEIKTLRKQLNPKLEELKALLTKKTETIIVLTDKKKETSLKEKILQIFKDQQHMIFTPKQFVKRQAEWNCNEKAIYSALRSLVVSGKIKHVKRGHYQMGDTNV